MAEKHLSEADIADLRDKAGGCKALRALFEGDLAWQIWFQGGRSIIACCEVACIYDDLSDIFSWLGYTIHNHHCSDSAISALNQSCPHLAAQAMRHFYHSAGVVPRRQFHHGPL